jgi:CRISPR-associated protein (TIGR02584 family)
VCPVKNILLAVAGLSPQVITETLYALNQMNRPVHAVHIITTRLGKDRLLSELLGGGGGPYYRYLEEYGTPAEGIEFGPGNIHVVHDDHGTELDDIRDEEDNARLLQLCIAVTFEFTRERDTAVFFSIAGGRKTMGACLTLAAQMYARSQDRLYHVLVPPEFEGNRRFFYPPKKSRPIKLMDSRGEPMFKATKYAHINLVHMPFFSIRSQLAPEYLDHPRDPATLMQSLIREAPELLEVNLIQGKIKYRGTEKDMMPARLALYAFFALRKKDCPQSANTCKSCDGCFLDAAEVFAHQDAITNLYRRLCGSRPLDEMSDSGILGLTAQNFNSYKARIRHDLRDAFGAPASEKLEIASTGHRPDTRYGLRLDKSAIEVVL